MTQRRVSEQKICQQTIRLERKKAVKGPSGASWRNDQFPAIQQSSDVGMKRHAQRLGHGNGYFEIEHWSAGCPQSCR
jgi:hypothetical protein